MRWRLERRFSRITRILSRRLFYFTHSVSCRIMKCGSWLYIAKFSNVYFPCFPQFEYNIWISHRIQTEVVG